MGRRQGNYFEIFGEGMSWKSSRRRLEDSIEKDRKQEIKMTRQEAMYKLRGFDDISRHQFISALEALGLIKFEEEKKLTPFQIIDAYNCSWRKSY